jgi:hypothetical protein
MSQSTKQSKLQIQDIFQLVELNEAQQMQVKGSAELLTNTRYYWGGVGIERLEIYQIQGL